jgi:pimeloyl-ACP methyl ester carboxylesterase
MRADGRLYWHWDPAMMSGPTRMEPPEAADRMLALAGNIHVPTLLARGLSSDVVNDAGVQELRAYMPQLEVFDVAGAGHMVAGDRNEIFLQGILDFFTRHHFAGSPSVAP